jgi:uncharacterized protein
MLMGSLKSGKGEVLAGLEATSTSFERMKGLLGRKELSRDRVLWISPCSSIHTFFMAFPIDVIFLNRQGQVLRIYRSLNPWRLSWWHPSAIGVLEAAAGSADAWNINVGDRLELCFT